MTTDTKARIIAYLKSKKQVAPIELIDYLGIGQRAVFKQLSQLRKKGAVGRLGKSPKVFYFLKENQPSGENMRKIDLISEAVRRFKKCEPQKVILFGSAVRNEKINDLDFLVVKDTQESWIERVVKIKNKYFNDWKFPMDLIVYTPDELEKALKENRMFVEEILKKGKVLYQKYEI